MEYRSHLESYSIMKKTTIFNPGIGKPNFGLPLSFGLPKNVNAGKPKNFGLPLVYRLVYRETPLYKGGLIKVNQVNQEFIKEFVIIVLNGNKSINASACARPN